MKDATKRQGYPPWKASLNGLIALLPSKNWKLGVVQPSKKQKKEKLTVCNTRATGAILVPIAHDPFSLRKKWYLWPDPIFEHAQSSSRFVFLANQICQIWQWVRELWTSGVGASQRSQSLVRKGSWASGPDNSDSETQTQCYSCICHIPVDLSAWYMTLYLTPFPLELGQLGCSCFLPHDYIQCILSYTTYLKITRCTIYRKKILSRMSSLKRDSLGLLCLCVGQLSMWILLCVT